MENTFEETLIENRSSLPIALRMMQIDGRDEIKKIEKLKIIQIESRYNQIYETAKLYKPISKTI